MILKVQLDENATRPQRAHEPDAGLDLFSREDKIIPARGSAKFDTGVHVEIPLGYGGFLESKSGLNINHDLLSFGTIDSGYTGSIVVKLYNMGDADYYVKAGDKISQLVIKNVILAGCTVVPQISGGERGNGGFGSTGR